MTVKDLIDRLLECPMEQEVIVFIKSEGQQTDVEDCDHTSIETTIYCS